MVTSTLVRLVYPRAEQHAGSRQKVDRGWDGKLASKRICFVDNGRPNADRVLALVEQEMVARFQVQPVRLRKKDHVKAAGLGTPTVVPLAAVAGNLEEQVDALVTGLGN